MNQLDGRVNIVYTYGMAEKRLDQSMEKVRARFKASRLSLQALGEAMGYGKEIARQSAFQFLKAGDPCISMLRRFAKAVGVTVEELVAERAKGRSGGGR